MASIDDELLKDAEDDARCVAFMRTRLNEEQNRKFSDELLYYFLDLIVEYYAESGVLDAKPDADGYVDIEEDAVADYLLAKAKKENMGQFEADDLLPIVEAEMDFAEQEV